ncbi:MFS transporter [Streptomyces sp. TG1A-60]|uniref:MFS transporter n=1 Tax=Streptomyces sp. TG1A-60 TaxID=3129111 RepID=UPI0030CD36E5
MTLSPACVPGAGDTGSIGVRRLTATLYGYAFLDDFVLLYPVYALLFSDTGLSIWQLSSLFALWSITGILLEVPSGAWADTVSRRLLLWLGPLLTAVGFALWVIVPSYWAFALGFVLWGVRGAIGSGALEALVYDELDRLGAADRYARVIGRAQAAGMVAVMAAMGLAGPVLKLGGYPAVGAASVLVCVLTSVVATRFPEHRTSVSGGDDRASTLITLRAGLAEVRRDRSVRAALLLVPAVGAVWGALDEYTPLLVRDTGVAEQTVPYLLLVIWVGPTIASLLTGPGERLGATGLGVVLAGSAFALAVGALLGTPAGIGLVAVAFGGFQLVDVLAGARLQDRIEGARRATLTSVASMGTELATVGVFAAYAVLGASFASHGVAFAVLAVPYLVTALVLARRDA